MTNALSASIQQLPALGLAEMRIAVLVVLLVTAAVIDYRTLKIPNWLTFGGVVTGLVLGTADALRPLEGLLAALGGAGAGLVILLPLYLLRVMGAGDVKLMAMVGAFLGVSGTLAAVLFTFIVGGIAALAFALWHRAFGRMAGNVRDIVQWMAFAAIAGLRPLPRVTAASSIGKLPYGISICAGTIASLAVTQLGLA
jgi:prepilin peptidase CpaA